jgi:hypothetical protein
MVADGRNGDWRYWWYVITAFRRDAEKSPRDAGAPRKNSGAKDEKVGLSGWFTRGGPADGDLSDSLYPGLSHFALSGLAECHSAKQSVVS